MGVSPDSHLQSLTCDRLGQETISPSDDSNSKRVYGNSLDEGASSFDNFETLLSDDNKEGNYTEVPMPSAFWSRRKYKLTNGRENSLMIPSNFT